jgi:arsenate reductase
MFNNQCFNVLFLWTGNSSRSIIAEALLNTLGADSFHAYSASSHPTGSVNPFALEQITRLGFQTERLRSKSWDEFAQANAPHMDFVITVCDNAAGEVCPRWPGHPITAHWSFEDPAACTGDNQSKAQLFARVSREIKNRLDTFTMLPFSTLSRLAIQQELDALGSTEHATN